MSKQILNLQAAPQPLKAGQKQIVKIAKGQHVRVQDLLEGAAKDASNVVVTKQAKDLKLKFADGTELQFENFYEECAGNACSITLAGKDATGYAINGDSAVGAATQDGSQLVYAYGDQTSLMAMGGSDSALSAALSELGSGVVTYVPAAVSSGFSSSSLGLIAAGLGLAAAGGSGGGSGGVSAGGSGGGKPPAPLTFDVQLTGDVISFDGTATGLIRINVNEDDQATFVRSGVTAVATVEGISGKTFNVPEGAELEISISGSSGQDTYTINAPNAGTLRFVGNAGADDDTLNLIIESATSNPDLRTLTLDTSSLTGIQHIRFVFPQDERDVVKLTKESRLTGFNQIEVSKGGVDLSAVEIAPGVEFIVNSTLILTLDQFKAMTSLVSVTGLGKLTINLTDAEATSGALQTFLSDPSVGKPILIGTVVTVKNAAGVTVETPSSLSEISYPSIPGLQAGIEALAQKIQGDGVVEKDFTTLAALKALIGTENTAAEGEESNATGLYALIGSSAGNLAKDIGAANTAAEGQPSNATGLYQVIETSIATAIDNLEQKIQGDGVVEKDFTTLAKLKALIGTENTAAEGEESNATGLYALIGSSAGNLAKDTAFDLDLYEYGLVDATHSTLDAADLGDATKVAELLNSLFQFSTSGEDSVLNTSIFAVTANDDHSATALWAHRQSSAHDSTVGAIELYQLALMDTIGGALGEEFRLQNFQGVMLPV